MTTTRTASLAEVVRINERTVASLETLAANTVDYEVYKGICGLLAGARINLANSRDDRKAELDLRVCN